MTSRNGFACWLFTYGAWLVLLALVALWVLPVPRTVRLLVSVAVVILCAVLYIALQRRRRAEGGEVR